jgi:hypothetical protein
VGRRIVAWVVAAVVTIGLVAGGVLLARGGGDPSPAVLPALDLGVAGQATAAAGSAGAIEPAPAPGPTEPAPAPGGTDPAGPAGGVDRSRLWPPVTYKLGGPLPRLPDRARAWKLGDTVDPARVATLAATLGLNGQPKEGPAGWTLRDGRRALVVHKLAGVPWSYGTGIPGTCVVRPGGPYQPGAAIQCLDPDAPVSNQPGPGVTGSPVAPARPFRPPVLPSRAEAQRVARDLAARAGLDLNGADVRVTDSLAARTVTIAPAVGGMPTSGFSWSISVGAKGMVRYASGYLAVPEPADTYPLIGVQEGFERLKKTAPFGGILRPGAATPAIAPDPCPGGAGVPCNAKRLRPRVATVTGARLGLQLAPAVAEGGGKPDVAYLLPAYLFDLEGGWTDVRAVIAVPERYLARP